MESNIAKTREFRLQQSEDKLKLSAILIKKGLYNDSITNSYLSIFYSVRVLLVDKNMDSDVYEDIVSLIEKYYVPLGWLSMDIIPILKETKNYSDMIESRSGMKASREDAERLIQKARDVLDEVLRVSSMNHR